MAKAVKVNKAKKAVKTVKKPSDKLGRNSDGTFAAGNKISKNNNGGRPAEDMSFRSQIKIRATNDPSLVQNALDTLIRIANNPEHPKCIDAIDKLIKLNGNYDPVETKNETKVSGSLETKAIASPLADLSREDLQKLLKRKK